MYRNDEAATIHSFCVCVSTLILQCSAVHTIHAAAGQIGLHFMILLSKSHYTHAYVTNEWLALWNQQCTDLQILERIINPAIRSLTTSFDWSGESSVFRLLVCSFYCRMYLYIRVLYAEWCVNYQWNYSWIGNQKFYSQYKCFLCSIAMCVHTQAMHVVLFVWLYHAKLYTHHQQPRTQEL